MSALWLVMKPIDSKGSPFTQKVRRSALGAPRAPGRKWQQQGKRVKRPDPRRWVRGAPAPNLTAVGGLAEFAAFCRTEGIEEQLSEQFGAMKTGPGVVYPMEAQMRLLIDAAMVGIPRVFGLEGMACDPLFTLLAGGAIPSIDTVYRDLQRFEPVTLERLEKLMAEQGLALVRDAGLQQLTLDIDSTVMEAFGEQQYAAVGYNPRYRGRRSYHPVIARVAETDTVIGARLRPGNTTFGQADVEDIEWWLDQARQAAPSALITVRMDRAGDAVSVLEAIDRKGALFVVKMTQTSNLLQAAMAQQHWQTIEQDADGNPIAQVAELSFKRNEWRPGQFRVIALRDRHRDNGRQMPLWPALDYSVRFYVTNDRIHSPEQIALSYDRRAGIETLIREGKDAFGIGKMPCYSFDANEAAMLIKLLAHNLLRRWVVKRLPPQVHHWRASWIRKLAIHVPARLLRSSRQWILRLAPRPMLN